MNKLLAVYVALINLPYALKEKDGGETLQNVIWILVGLAIALAAGWLFFKPQIDTFTQELWQKLSGWAKGNIDVKLP